MSTFFSSLRVRLLLLVLLSALPALGLTLYTGLDQQRLAQEAAQQDTLRIARLAASNQESLVEGAHQLLVTLAQVPQVRDTSPGVCQNFLSGLNQQYPGYASLNLANATGDIYCSSVETNQAVNIADRDYFQAALQTHSFVIGSYIIDRLSGKAVLPFAYPILDSKGQVQDVLVATLDLNWLNELAPTIQLPQNSSLLIVDNNGTILARYPNPSTYIGQHLNDAPLIHQIIQNQGEGTTETSGIDGIDRLYAFYPLTGPVNSRAFVAVGIPTAIAYAGVHQLLVRNLVALGGVTLFALILALIISDYFILRHVDALMKATHRLAAGDLAARANMPANQGELSRLSQDFDRMADHLQERENLLREAEAKYRSLVEQIPAVIYTYSIDAGKPLYISPQVNQVLGFSPGQWLSTPSIWADHLYPEDRERVLAEREQAYRNGHPFQAEYRLRTGTGRIVWIRDEASMVKDTNDAPLFLQGILIDITDRKQAEAAMKVYAGQLERSNRELQDFAYISSHDLQEPLRKIQAFGDRLKMKYQEALSEEGQDYINRMQSAASRMQNMINDLLSYSRVTTRAQAFQSVDLQDCVAGVISDLEARITETGGCVEVGNLPTLEAEPTQMRQLLQNLIGNALKFHKPGVPPEVHVSGEVIESGGWKPELVRLTVADNGIGFDEKYLDRIFQPFQRLMPRTQYEGSGIGLAICRKIVDRHNGQITAKSTPGAGTTFIVTLPRKQNEEGDLEAA